MNKGIFAIFFVVAVLSISFPVNAQKTAQRVGEGYTSEGIYYRKKFHGEKKLMEAITQGFLQ